MKTAKVTAANISWAITLIGNTSIDTDHTGHIPATKTQARALLNLLAQRGYTLATINTMKSREWYALRAAAINA